MENELLRRIEKLEKELNLLKAGSTIPFEVEQAFRNRLRISQYSTLVADSKAASSENQAVNEAGASSYNVLKPPDRFIATIINNTTVYIPGYN